MAVKHRQLARQVSVFIKHPPENWMAALSFTSTVLDEGTTFIFGFWICVANDLGGFNSRLVDSRKPEASAPTRSSNLDEFINNLDELLLPDLARQIEKMSIFDATSTHAAPGLSDRIQTDLRRLLNLSPSPTWRSTWIVFLRFETREPPLFGGSPFSTTTQTQTKSTR
jgi:hypothetical protein